MKGTPLGMSLADPEIHHARFFRDAYIQYRQQIAIHIRLKALVSVLTRLRIGLDGHHRVPQMPIIGSVVPIVHSHVIDEIRNHVGLPS